MLLLVCKRACRHLSSASASSTARRCSYPASLHASKSATRSVGCLVVASYRTVFAMASSAPAAAPAAAAPAAAPATAEPTIDVNNPPQDFPEETTKFDSATATTIPESCLPGVPDAVIDDSGAFKYVLVKVTNKDGKESYFVRQHDAHFHSDVFAHYRDTLEVDGATTKVMGGGRIWKDTKTGTIYIYGMSVGYGLAPHDISAAVVHRQWPDAEIRTSNDGY